MSFARIQDQEIALRLLRGIVRRGRMPNGLLFWGPGGVGKGLTAREFAKAVNCTESPDDACDACLSCRKIEHGNHADVMRISPTGKTRIFKVEAIEELNETAAYRPFEGGSRIVIIEDADRMRVDAQNHFLKTLEEPPSKTTFILLTEWPRHLLPTIRSRCQRVRFGALRPETVVSMLAERADLTPEACRTLAALSGGSMARAIQLVETDRRPVVMDMVCQLAAGTDPLFLSEQFGVHIQTTEKRITAQVFGESSATARSDSEEESAPDKEELEAHVTGLVRQEMLEHLILFDAWYRDELIHGITGNLRFAHNQDHAHLLPKTGDAEKQKKKLQAIADAWKYIERNMNKTRIFRDLFFVLAS
jgi:DNA polymerase III delta' subunit